MAIISEQTYIADGSQRQFQVLGTILSESHLGVWFTVGGVETRIATSEYDVLGSVVLFNTAPASGTSIALLLSDSGEDLDVPPSAIADVSTNIDDVIAVAGNEDNINTVAGIAAEITALAVRTAAIDSLYADKATLDSLYADKAKLDSLFADKLKLDSLYADKATLDSLYADKAGLDAVYANLTEILLADDNAATATAKANDAQLRAWESEAERMTADSYATEAEDVFVKVYTSNGDGTFTATDTTEYSALHWKIKAEDLVTNGVIDDSVPQLDKTYSSVKVQALHDAQAIAIANLSGASASFYNNTTTVIPETPVAFVDLTWTNGTASSNSAIFELGTNEISFKQDGSYNFLNTLTFYRLSDGSVMNVTFELYDADTSSVLATFVQPIDMIAGTKETVPMNALLVVSGASVADPVRMKVRMQASSASGTLELFSFNSIIALGSVPVSATITQVDAALGTIYEGLA